MDSPNEQHACTPTPINAEGFNVNASLPYGLRLAHIQSSMEDFLAFLGFVNRQLNSQGIQRLESMLMPANFSSIVGEFMSTTIPKYCVAVVKNKFHNGHPDLIPASTFENDAIRYGTEGIEIKASRYGRGWQGHNPEDVWLMVFVFESNRPNDQTPKPFRFISVAGAKLLKSDWGFSGRSATSRRTITASVAQSGYQKMQANWIYRA